MKHLIDILGIEVPTVDFSGESVNGRILESPADFSVTPVIGATQFNIDGLGDIQPERIFDIIIHNRKTDTWDHISINQVWSIERGNGVVLKYRTFNEYDDIKVRYIG